MENTFPTHWGEPPRIQTRDYVELPGGYGFGSGTLRKWIERKMAEDASNASPWGNLVGMDGQEAKQKILETESTLQVEVIPYGSMVTMDYRTDRVRVFVDSGNKVASQPQKG